MYTYRFPETIINLILGIIEFFLGLRFVFKLFGANAGAPFVKWLYAVSDPLMNPFRNIFPSPQISGNFVVEFTTLVALIVYLLVGYLILELIAVTRRLPRE